jgi:hypothetical protein
MVYVIFFILKPIEGKVPPKRPINALPHNVHDDHIPLPFDIV